MQILFICGIIVELIVEFLKRPVPEKYKNTVVPLISMAVGVIIAFETKQGIFELMGVPFEYEWVDYFFTGLAYSGGSRGLHELMRRINGTAKT